MAKYPKPIRVIKKGGRHGWLRQHIAEDQNNQRRMGFKIQDPVYDRWKDGGNVVEAVEPTVPNAPQKPKGEVEREYYETLSIEELKALLDAKNIKYHHKAGKEKLIEKLI